MRSLLLFLSNPLVLIALWALFIWLLFRSPFLAWLAKMALLVGWGLMTVGATLFVMVAIYFPRGEYVAAVFALLAGSAVSFFWFVAGLPEIAKSIRAAKNGIPWWTS
jgi:hypothetical protein